MDIRDYAELIAAKIENAKVVDVVKDNGQIKTGLLIKEDDCNTAPNIYIDGIYEEGYSVEKAVEYVKKTYETYKLPNMNYDFLHDYSKVIPRLKAKLLNADKNAYIGMNAQKFGFKDLIIVPYINVNDIVPDGSIRVTEKMLDMWSVSIDEVAQDALKNIRDDVEIINMADMLPFSPLTPITKQFEFYVVSNKEKMYGAVAALFAIANMKKRYENGIKVIPSSVHEMIIIPNLGKDDGKLDAIIDDVNRTCIRDEDYLSNHSYEFG